MTALVGTNGVIFASAFAWVFLLGMQQQNITGEHHVQSVVMSYLLAIVFFMLIDGMGRTSMLEFVMAYGTGSASGASLSMIVHKRLVRGEG